MLHDLRSLCDDDTPSGMLQTQGITVCSIPFLMPVVRDMFHEVRTEACLWQVCLSILIANGIVLCFLLLIASFAVHMG
jgi:hypothetical protein